MADIFKEIIPSILTTKKYELNDELDEKQYNPYLVNKTLSSHIDCIFYVNEMNTNYFLSNKMQYDYLFHSVRKMKRSFKGWDKKEKSSDDFLSVKSFFGFSNEKTKSAMEILTKDEIHIIKEKMKIGGVVSKKNK